MFHIVNNDVRAGPVIAAPGATRGEQSSLGLDCHDASRLAMTRRNDGYRPLADIVKHGHFARMERKIIAWPSLIGLLIAQLWAAHAVVFFTHEYAHSFTAWLLGWKSNPLDLNYAHPTLKVILLQLGIDQNVNEVPIFTSGHGADAALIAAAGAVLGNGLIALPLSRLAFRAAIQRRRFGWALFAYWCTVASVGNFFDYVPIRTFTLGGDMGSVERGFGWSPWTLLVIFGVPTLIAMMWLFLRVVPSTLRQLFPTSATRQALVAVVTVGVMFGFFGAVGLLEGGPVSHWLSTVSVELILPVAIVVALLAVFRMKATPNATALRAE